MKRKPLKIISALVMVFALVATLGVTCFASVVATTPSDGRQFNFVDYTVEYTTYDTRYDEYSTKYASPPSYTDQPIASVKYDGYNKTVYYPSADFVVIELYPALGAGVPIEYGRIRVRCETAYNCTLTAYPSDPVLFREALGGANLGDYNPADDLEWEALCHVRIEYTDGYVEKVNAYMDSTTADHYYTPSDFVYDVATASDRPLDTIKTIQWSDFDLTIRDGSTSLDYCRIGFVGTPTATWLPFDVSDYSPPTIIQEVIFDGNVGVADLLIGPLEALINFEIFPNFSLGSVFAILAGIGLFVIVLKVFAGG